MCVCVCVCVYVCTCVYVCISALVHICACIRGCMRGTWVWRLKQYFSQLEQYCESRMPPACLHTCACLPAGYYQSGYGNGGGSATSSSRFQQPLSPTGPAQAATTNDMMSNVSTSTMSHGGMHSGFSSNKGECRIVTVSVRILSLKRMNVYGFGAPSVLVCA